MKRFLKLSFFLLTFILLLVVSINVIKIKKTFKFTNDEQIYIDGIKNKELTLTTANEMAYFESFTGQQVGFLLPILDLLNNKWGLNVKINNVSIDRYYELLSSGNSDIYGPILVNSEVSEKFKYSDGIIDTKFIAITKYGKEVKTFKELKGKKVGVIKKFLYMNSFLNYVENESDLIVEESNEALFEKLNDDTFDVIVYANSVFSYLENYQNFTFELLHADMPFEQSLVTKKNEMFSLMNIISRFLSSDEGQLLKENIDTSFNYAVFQNNLAKYQNEIEIVKNNYSEIKMIGNTTLYPFCYYDKNEYKGYQADVNKLMSKILGIPVDFYQVNRSTFNTTEMDRLFNNGIIQGITGIYEDNSGANFSIPLYQDKLQTFKLKETNLKNKTILTLNVGTTQTVDEYFNLSFDFPKPLLTTPTREQTIDNLYNKNIDIMIVSKMTVDYLRMFQKNTKLERYDNTELNANLSMRFSQKNISEFNTLFNAIYSVYGKLNITKYEQNIENIIDYKFEYSLAHEAQRKNTLVMVFVLSFSLLFLGGASVVIFIQVRKNKIYEKRVAMLIDSQASIDFGYVDIKKATISSHGGWSLLKKYGLNPPSDEVISLDEYNRLMNQNNPVQEDVRNRIVGATANEKQEALYEVFINNTKVTLQRYVYRISSTSFMYSLLDLTEEKNAQEKLKELADIDYLSKAYTRRAFFNRLSNVELSNKYIAILDIDNFKMINDKYNHETGDSVIARLVEKLKEYSIIQSVCR